MAVNNKAWDIGFRREIGDESNPTWSIVVGGTSNALHLIDPLNAGTDFALSADTTPTLYIHGSATAPTEYVKIYTDETDGYIDVVGGHARIKSAGDVRLDPLYTTGFVQVLGTASWVANGTGTVTIALLAPTGVTGSSVAEWLKVKNEDGSTRLIPSWT